MRVLIPRQILHISSIVKSPLALIGAEHIETVQ